MHSPDPSLLHHQDHYFVNKHLPESKTANSQSTNFNRTIKMNSRRLIESIVVKSDFYKEDEISASFYGLSPSRKRNF